MNIPEKWCVKVTNANKDVLSSWRTDGDLGNRNYDNLKEPFYLHTPMQDRNGYNKQNISSGYTEITFEQFEKYILNKETSAEDYSYLIKLFKELNIN